MDPAVAGAKSSVRDAVMDILTYAAQRSAATRDELEEALEMAKLPLTMEGVMGVVELVNVGYDAVTAASVIRWVLDARHQSDPISGLEDT